jgi:hypothetical protein
MRLLTVARVGLAVSVVIYALAFGLSALKIWNPEILFLITIFAVIGIGGSATACVSIQTVPSIRDSRTRAKRAADGS